MTSRFRDIPGENLVSNEHGVYVETRDNKTDRIPGTFTILIR